MAPVVLASQLRRQAAPPLPPGYAPVGMQQPSLSQQPPSAPIMPPSGPSQAMSPGSPSGPPQVAPAGPPLNSHSGFAATPPQGSTAAMVAPGQQLPPSPMIQVTGPVTGAGAPAGASSILGGGPIVTQTFTAQPTGGAYGYGPPPNAVPGGVFGQQDPYSAKQKNTTGSDSGTAIAIGVVVGLLALAILAFMRWRYWQYRKNGGTGTKWEAFFGKSQRKEEAKAKAEQKDTWKNWPMLRYVPKYTFGDAAADNDKKEREEEDRKKKMAAASKK